jgi:ubiquinone/menaquinone biosynthesis C-methylase UbiE
MRYTPELVLKVNEVFHDVEGAAYAGVHPEIFEGETARWDEIALSEISPRRHPIRVMDVGCGTGFVAERVAPVLTGGDTFVCADLSQAMLDACQRTLGNDRFACRFEFVKLDGQALGQPDGSCDVVTMNSVLHHLPDPPTTLRQIGRILKSGGCFIVAHEPNRRFYASPAMRTRARFAGMVAAPKQTVGAALRRLGLMSVVHRVVRQQHHTAVLDEVNRQLLDAKVIERPLTQDELTSIVDVQSPTAGGWHPDRGIDIETLARDHMPDFDCRLVTYDHLGSGTDRPGGVLAAYSKRLARKRPKDGATLLAVLTKKTD